MSKVIVIGCPGAGKYELLEKYKENHNIIVFKSRKEADDYISNIEK